MTASFPKPRPDMRGPYLIRNPRAYAAMRLWDFGLRLISPPRKPVIPSAPARILLANWAHLGDAITTIGALTKLRQSFPAARIDMIVGHGNLTALKDCGLIDHFYLLDHPRLNRAGLSKAEKKRRYREDRCRVIREIRAVGYEVALDFYPYFPPAHPLFFRAGIPVRIGYTSGGFGPLLSHPVRWKRDGRPMSDAYRDLLDVLLAEPVPEGALRPEMAPEACVPLPAALGKAGPYLVLHPGAGAPQRQWGQAKWSELIAALQKAPESRDLRIVLTGAGAGECAIAAQIAAEHPGIINLAGACSWQEFLSVMCHAALVICPDTSAAHAAALFATPTVGIFAGMNDPRQWGPANPNRELLIHPVPCHPCHRYGCATMACLKEISVADVLAAVRTRLTIAPAQKGRCA